MLIKEPSDRPGFVRVTFRFPSVIWAESVYLVGDFNRWDRTRHPMARHNGGGDWEIQLELPEGQSFAYRYLVNHDTWCNDCNADAYIPDPYGTFNSVVRT